MPYCNYLRSNPPNVFGQGPIYRVRWSPFVADIFLSCSADWTVKLWHQDRSTPLYSFHAAQVDLYLIPFL